MPWLSRNNFQPSDKLHSDDLNNLANDDHTWGGNVNGGGYTLSNVHVIDINPLAAGQVTSVFGRTGDVVATAGDYTAALVGAVPTARRITTAPGSGLSGGGPLSADLTLSAAVTTVFTRTGDVTLTGPDITNAGGVLNTRQVKTLAGSGLSGGGPLSTDLSLSVTPDTTNQQVQVMSQGNPVGSPRHAINFISGTGALITVSEISASNRIDVTVASTGTGGGMVDPTQVVGDLIVRGLTAPPTRLAVGTDGQVLTADHLQALGVKWATPSNTGQVTSVFTRSGAVVAAVGDYSAAQITNAVDQTGSYVNPPWITSLPWSKITNPPAFMLDPTVAKGDLIVHGATTTRLPLGVDGSILTADSTLAAGVKWGAVPMTSFNTRGGAVMPQGGDYTVAQVTGAVATTLTINTGTGLQGGGNLSSNRTLAVVPDTTNQQIQVLLAGAVVGTRHAINFVNGANVSLSISDNAGSNQIDLTVSSTGGGGGMVDPTTGIGDLIVRGATAVQRLGVGLNGQVLTSDNTQALGVRWAVPTGGGGGGSQSPWIGDVDAAGHALNNAAGIGVNIAAAPTGARIYAYVSGTEQAFAGVINNAANAATIALLNDVNDSIALRSYGTGFVGGLPGLASLEATNTLAILASGGEVMRLKSGRVLIGTTTDDTVNKLQVNGKVKSLTGGFVFPDNTVQTTAYTAGSSPVTSVFTRTGAIVAVAGDYTAALVTNAVDSSSSYSNPSWISSLAWSKITGAPALLVDPTTTKGDLIARGAAAPATRLPASATDNWVLTADSSAALGVKWAAVPPSPQTPWATDIDGAGHKLKNAGRVSIGNDGTVLPDGGNTDLRLIVGSTAVSGPAAQVNLIGNSATDATLAQINAANYNLVTTEKRVATLNMLSLGGSNTGAMDFYTWNAGSPVLAMRVKPTGVGILTNSSQFPFQVHAGTDQNLAITGQQAVTGSVAIHALNDAVSANMPLEIRGNPTVFWVGNVGIATTSPQSSLQILSPANSPSLTYHAAASLDLDVAGGIELAFGAINANPWPCWIQARGSSNAANPLCLNPLGGNVAIGMTNPGEQLSLGGYGAIAMVTGNTLSYVTHQYLAASGYDCLSLSGNYRRTDASAGTIVNPNLATAEIQVLSAGGNVGQLRFATGTNNVAPIVRMTIDQLGKVGIGQPNPQSILHIIQQASGAVGPVLTLENSNGLLHDAASIKFVDASQRSELRFSVESSPYGADMIYYGGAAGTTEVFRATSGGNVGIGTASPGTALSFGATDSREIIRLWDTGLASTSAGIGKFPSEIRHYLPSGNFFSWYTGGPSGTELMRISAAGQVGIGVSPGYKLDVGGTINATGNYSWNGAVIGIFATRNDVTASRAVNQVYGNPYGRPMLISVTAMVNSSQYMQLLTDGGNPPGTLAAVVTNTNTTGTSGTYTVTGLVMPGHYYKVFLSGGSLTIWLEWA